MEATDPAWYGARLWAAGSTPVNLTARNGGPFIVGLDAFTVTAHKVRRVVLTGAKGTLVTDFGGAKASQSKEEVPPLTSPIGTIPGSIPLNDG